MYNAPNCKCYGQETAYETTKTLQKCQIFNCGKLYKLKTSCNGTLTRIINAIISIGKTLRLVIHLFWKIVK